MFIFNKLIHLHPADSLEILESLKPTEQQVALLQLKDEDIAKLLPYMGEELRDSLPDIIEAEVLASALAKLQTDDAIDVLDDLEVDEQHQILHDLPTKKRVKLERVLALGDDVAGRIMQDIVITANINSTIGEVGDVLRASGKAIDNDFHNIYVLNNTGILIGYVHVSKLIVGERDVLIKDMMLTLEHYVYDDDQQSRVANLFKKYGLVELPVLNRQTNKVVGSITADDIVDILEEEADETIYGLSGVSQPTARLFRYSSFQISLGRFPWLAVNLLTAILVSAVISIFTPVLDKVVYLAILMPIVASMAGNAGTQSLALVTRGLGVGNIDSSNDIQMIKQELWVGVYNGIFFAIIMAVITWFWFSDINLVYSIIIAMLITLGVSTLSGALIPIIIQRFGIDPAIASSIFLTTLTDIVGFASFLGSAYLLIL
jgi:magnesium transporter